MLAYCISYLNPPFLVRTLLNPKWLWLLNTLPVAVLLALLSAEYNVIRSLLSPEGQRYWQGFGGVLLGLSVLHAGYAAWQWRRQKELSVGYAVGALVVYITLLYSYFTCLNELLPFTIPRWMVPGDLPLYAGTFLMPTLAHAAAVLVVRFTPAERPHRALPSFGLALAVPVGWYVFAQLVLPLWHGQYRRLEHLMVILLITSTVAFLVLLARGVYILTMRRAGSWTRYRWAWVLLVAGVLPVLGLAVNDGSLFSQTSWMGKNEGGIFGDFSGPWWYGLTLLNAALLCIPAPTSRWVRLALYLGRGIMFSYTLYFFLVFLPFLPLSVVAVAAVGVGFLMLTPLVLFVVHAWELTQDYAALQTFFARRWLLVGLVVAVAVLPLGLTLRYQQHRIVLHQALDYVYAPEYARHYTPLDTATLDGTLAVVRGHKEQGSQSITGARLPYLSSYFNWLVLDNLTLSETKIATLGQVFFGHRAPRLTEPTAAGRSAAPTLTHLAARSRYDTHQQAWVSWVDLTLANNSAASLAEYATTFDLPAGCFISDYYLDIAGRREPGILAEKRAAAWVYSRIRTINRDPGLLQCLNGNRVALRVFPFASGEVRRTGMQLLHKEPLNFTLDGQTIALGRSTASAPAADFSTSGVAYVSATHKAALPVVRRRPYVHFVVDVSAGQEGSRAALQHRIQEWLTRQGGAADARFTFTNTYARPLPPGANWQAALAASPHTGGFYLDRAIRQVLVQAAEHPRNQYPVIVVVSADFSRAILPTSFADLRHAFPESDAFYELMADTQLVAHSLLTNPATPGAMLLQPTAPAPVVAWPTAHRPAAYLPANGQPEVVLTQPALLVPETAMQPRSWRSGLLLQGLWRAQVQHPETTEAASHQLVSYSFQSAILTPLTSYLALENEAQKAALRRKQAQLLAGHAALDAGEDEQRMSEPGDVVLLLVGAAVLGGYWLRRKRNGAARAIA